MAGTETLSLNCIFTKLGALLAKMVLRTKKAEDAPFLENLKALFVMVDGALPKLLIPSNKLAEEPIYAVLLVEELKSCLKICPSA
ncbi:hypothetical protein D3C80_1552520 [compost metagenome]